MNRTMCSMSFREPALDPIALAFSMTGAAHDARKAAPPATVTLARNSRRDIPANGLSLTKFPPKAAGCGHSKGHRCGISVHRSACREEIPPVVGGISHFDYFSFLQRRELISSIKSLAPV